MSGAVVTRGAGEWTPASRSAFSDPRNPIVMQRFATTPVVTMLLAS